MIFVMMIKWRKYNCLQTVTCLANVWQIPTIGYYATVEILLLQIPLLQPSCKESLCCQPNFLTCTNLFSLQTPRLLLLLFVCFVLFLLSVAFTHALFFYPLCPISFCSRSL